MTPWNPFHVREYDPSGLRTTLEQAFTEVEIRGLHANEPFHSTELRRVQGAREAARAAADRGLGARAKRALKSLLPEAALAGLRKLRGGPAASGAAEPLPEASLGDFRYETERLDEALDLLATCRRS